ncbi:MAG: STAS domain-containing protein [Firmicutes bacterium]|nr:STAS domain-containing protein [Bacillota bacterium]
MTINKTLEDGTLTVALEGRLDTFTAPDLENELDSSLEGVKEVVLDLAGLEYISSAGLRVLLSTQKKMNAAEGTLIVRNINEIVKEVFEVTGFDEILTIEGSEEEEPAE